MDKETYRKISRKQIRDGKAGLYCYICGESSPVVLVMHHLEGKMNSDRLIPLCQNCHAKISSEQNKVVPIDRSSSASSVKKIGFWLITIGALLREVGQRMIDFGHELIEYD